MIPAFKRILDPELAEDLTGETFLKAQQNLWKFRWQGVTVGAWFFRIAENEIRMHLRKSRPMLNLHETDHVSGDDPLAQVILDDQQRRVRRLVATLPADMRRVFLLFYWDDLRVREIAAIIGVKEGTVKSRLSRARNQCYDVLALQDRLGQPSGDTEHNPDQSH